MTQMIKVTDSYSIIFYVSCVICNCHLAHNYLKAYFNYLWILFILIARYLLAFVFIPVIQKEMGIFRETVWNSHRIRKQKDAQLPKGIPNHVYHFPEKYGADDGGMDFWFYWLHIICRSVLSIIVLRPWMTVSSPSSSIPFIAMILSRHLGTFLFKLHFPL